MTDLKNSGDVNFLSSQSEKINFKNFTSLETHFILNVTFISVLQATGSIVSEKKYGFFIGMRISRPKVFTL